MLTLADVTSDARAADEARADPRGRSAPGASLRERGDGRSRSVLSLP